MNRSITLSILLMWTCSLLACGRDDEPTSDDPRDTDMRADMTRDQGAPDASPDDMPTQDADMSQPDATMQPDMADMPDMASDIPDMTVNQPDMQPAPTGTLGWHVASSQVGQRPLIAELYGTQGPLLYVLSAIHGNERLAVTYGERMRTLLQGGMAEQLGVRVFYVAIANPDGVTANTRANARNVDLNRNFPADNFDPSAGGGSRPQTESESIMLVNTLEWTRPVGVVSVHCCVPIMDYDGPNSKELAEQMSDAMLDAVGLFLPAERLGSRPGSMGSYVGLTLGLPIITFEFASAHIMDALDQLVGAEAATEAALLWTAMQDEEPPADLLDRIQQIAGSNYSQRSLGESAGGLPIRVDTLGSGSQGALILSGFDLRSRRGETIAEHLRRMILSEITPTAAESFTMVTLANPDAVRLQDSANADGIDLLDDLNLVEPMSSEALAIETLIEDDTITKVYLVEEDVEDTISLHGPDAAALQARLMLSMSTLTLKQEAPSRYRALIQRLTQAGKTVVFLGVASDRLEAQNRGAASALTYRPPLDFWLVTRDTL